MRIPIGDLTFDVTLGGPQDRARRLRLEPIAPDRAILDRIAGVAV
jgi:hypothetical protein